VKDFRGKTAFITGGASGIGFGMARAFGREGMNVVVADINLAAAKAAVEKLAAEQVKAVAVKVDVTERASMKGAALEAIAAFGKIHVLCNNAGIGMSVPISKAGYADWDLMMGVNVGGVVNGVVTLLPRIRRHGEGGHIVNTSSAAGILPLPDAGGIYTASKFAVRGLSESLRLALVADRIGVSTLFPGLTRSRILDGAKQAAAKGGEELDPVSASFAVAQQHAMDPMDLAGAVLDAIRSNSPYILAHPEFREEIEDLHQELMAAIRDDLPAHPGRLEMEAGRRQHIAELKAEIKAW